MTRRMLRHEIPVDDDWHSFVGSIRHIATRNPRVVEVWAEHDDDPTVHDPTQNVIIVGTGHEWPPCAEWIGTALAPSGLVWHLLAATQ